LNFDILKYGNLVSQQLKKHQNASSKLYATTTIHAAIADLSAAISSAIPSNVNSSGHSSEQDLPAEQATDPNMPQTGDRASGELHTHGNFDS